MGVPTVKHRMHNAFGKSLGVTLWAILLIGVTAVAEETDVVRAVKMDPDKLAGIDLPAEDPFIAPEDVLDGSHAPRGEVLYYGDQLILEVYEDKPATVSRRNLLQATRWLYRKATPAHGRCSGITGS